MAVGTALLRTEREKHSPVLFWEVPSVTSAESTVPKGHLWHEPEGCQGSSWHVPAGRGRRRGTWAMAAEHRTGHQAGKVTNSPHRCTAPKGVQAQTPPDGSSKSHQKQSHKRITTLEQCDQTWQPICRRNGDYKGLSQHISCRKGPSGCRKLEGGVVGICSTHYGTFNRTERGLEVRNKHGEIQGRTRGCWSVLVWPSPGPECTSALLSPHILYLLGQFTLLWVQNRTLGSLCSGYRTELWVHSALGTEQNSGFTLLWVQNRTLRSLCSGYRTELWVHSALGTEQNAAFTLLWVQNSLWRAAGKTQAGLASKYESKTCEDSRGGPEAG
ncbi:uncharacterized protein LOC121337192 [Onychostruthus taczanowskii]|uniref:uncharacterized protein LOC121337192 n=1 Tax=Onychostruthus taczanowskii TaxID=356909 RepID=UPI001B807000|nr:uncharacterized protein LOC121337192 [Onychostruthus taczanowskii]